MVKVLVIRKTDKTIHKVAIENKATLMAFSNRLPAGQQWKFEEMEEEEAEKLPFIDDSYVTAAEAQDKAKVLEVAVSEKDAKIAELEALLAAKNTTPVQLKAEEVIEKITKATTVDEVKILLGDDVRVTVKKAADAKIAELEAQ